MLGTEESRPLPITDKTFQGWKIIYMMHTTWNKLFVVTRNKRREKTIFKILALVIFAKKEKRKKSQCPSPGRIRKAGFLKYKLNGEQNSNVAKPIKMLKT